MAPLIFQLASDALAPLQMETDPIGWDGLRTRLARDPLTHGILVSMSADLTFVKQAAAYIRTVYEGGHDQNGTAVAARGVEGLVTLTVYEQNPNEFTPEEIYRGRLDFTTYVSAESGVTCKFKETGFATTLLTRDQTAVDLLGNESLSGTALPSYAPVYATLHSQETLQRYEARQSVIPTVYDSITISDSDGVSGEFGGSVLVRVGFPDEVINEFGVQHGFGLYLGDTYSPLNTPLYTTKEAGVFTIAFSFYADMTARFPRLLTQHIIDTNFYYEIVRAGGGGTGRINLYSHSVTVSIGSDPDYTHRNTAFIPAQVHTETLGVGDKIYLFGEYYIHDISSDYSIPVTSAFLRSSYFRMQAVTTTAATTCAGLLVHEALARCCEASTDQRDSLYSEYYGRTDCRLPYAQNGPGSQRIVTNGFYLRGFPLPSAPAPVAPETDNRKTLNGALRDLYQSLDAIDCLGMGLEQREGRPVVRIEPRSYFYQAGETLRLGAVSALKKSVYVEWLYNTADVGYSHWQSGAPNGLDEFNALRTYALPITQVKKAYAATSTLNTAGYLIEQARRDPYTAGVSKEGQADSELFLITLRFVPEETVVVGPVTVAIPAHYAAQRNEAFVTGGVSGILSPATAYNLTLSPGRMLQRHGPWLRSGLSALTSRRLLLSKGEGNTHLKSQLIGETAPLDEFAAVAVSDLAAPIALAETYEFTTRLRRGQLKQLLAAPYGRLSFLDTQGVRKAGYLLNAERAPQSGLTTFTLLRAA